MNETAMPKPEVRSPSWMIALSTTLGMQINASMLDQCLAIIAPLLTRGLGVAPERIGNLSSISSLGVVTFLLLGGPLLARLGPVRTLQLGALVAVCGLLLVTTALWPLILCAPFLIGLGYGPSPPAGSRILARTAPARHRTLIFSVKQAGAPIGGAVAALILAPVAAHWGWRAALVLAIAISVAAVFAIEPTRAQLDDERRRDQPVTLAAIFSPKALAAPFVMLTAERPLLLASSLAFSFAMMQGSLFSFSVTYLTSAHGLSLADAGMAYATMLSSGAVARVVLGWLADRTGTPALNLAVQAVVAAGLAATYGSLPASAPMLLVMLCAGAAGFVAASWNGIFMAEVARLAPPDRVAEVTSSTTLVAFAGYVAGPSLFSLLVSLSGGYRVAFLVLSLQLLAAGLFQLVRLLSIRLRRG